MAKKKMRGEMDKNPAKAAMNRANVTTGETEFASDLTYGTQTNKNKQAKEKKS